MSDPIPRTIDLLYTEVEDELRASVRALMDKRSPWAAVLARTESADTTDRQLWDSLAGEIGCAALAVPEETGGAGASWRESAVVAEELGRAVAPVPFLGSAGIAVALLQALDERDLLAKVAGGATIAALAVPFATAPGTTVDWAEVSNGRISGTVDGVADADAADIFLVPAGGAVHTISRDAPGLQCRQVVSLDMTRPLVDLAFHDVPARRLDTVRSVPEAVTAALHIGAVLLASEQLGVAQRCLELTVEYLMIRRQFGRIIGSYQALKHRLADLWVLISQARAVARYAADCAATNAPGLPVAAAVAQAHCSTVAQQAAEECIQLHGGIGFTWEHPAHLYLKRAKSGVIALGTPDRHRARLADLVNIPGPLCDNGSRS
ncbi:acyl-CoA dehydrogenase family protein [Nocardia mikamii]|uniref:acyl-CoA dehydrogenase family protein n=1 Tax=Nocardia mikamii TaxID=508464 RepID=UPI0007A40F61|nr:acyl-CoA dehydrogenase family protein [Nocardia mikamii]